MLPAFEWFGRNTNVTINNAVTVEKSVIDDPSSGYGLFVDLEKIDLEPETLELLRIPKLVTFDIQTTLNILGDETQYSSHREARKLLKRVKEAFGDLLKLDIAKELLTETTILIFYFSLLALIKDSYELPRVLRFYLEAILLETKVSNGIMCIESVIKSYRQYRSLDVPNELLELLDGFFSTNVKEAAYSKSILKQVYAAIVSRCLEIPEGVNGNTDDFFVNTTLVPLLDFANHSNQLQNAYFDVDRKTKDVLLLLDLRKIPKCKRRFEVFISYSPVEDIMSFISLYGFVPSSKSGLQFLNLSLDRDYLLTQNVMQNVNLRLFFKWLRINPVIQLIKYHDQWYINDKLEDFAHFLLAFMGSPEDRFSSCWKFDDERYKTFYFFQNHSSRKLEDHISLEDYKRRIEQKENDDSDLIDLPQLAWSMTFRGDDHKTYHARLTKQQALEVAPLDDEQLFNDAIDSFSSFFLKYLRWRIAQLEKLTSESSSAFEQLVLVEKDVLRKVKQGNRLQFWSDSHVEIQNGECSLPSPLLKSGIEAAHDKSQGGIKSGNLTLKDFNPEEFTDFLQEELAFYADLV